MKWKQNKIIRWIVLLTMLLTSIPMTAFAQMYSGTCVVTVSSKGHGVVYPEGELSVWPGEKANFTMTPDQGYQISSVSVNGVRLTDAELENVIQTGTYSLTGIYSDASMEVIFRAKRSYSQHIYTVIGPESICGVTKDPTAVWNEMYESQNGEFEAVYENVAAGYYEFWVAKDHGWTEIYGKEGTQDPVGVEVVQDGERIKIKFDEMTGMVSIEQELQVEETESSTEYVSEARSEYLLQEESLSWYTQTAVIEEDDSYESARETFDEMREKRITFSSSSEEEAVWLSEQSNTLGYCQVIVAYSAGGIVVAPDTAWVNEQGVVQIPQGEAAFFSFLPDDGYQVKDIYIDGTALTGIDKDIAVADGGFVFWDTTRDRSIYVEFESSGQSEEPKYRVSVSFQGNGTVQPSAGFTTTEDGVVYVPQGEYLSLFFYPYDGYEVSQILLDGAAVSDAELEAAKSTNSFTIWGVWSDHSVVITFGEKQEQAKKHTISLTSGAGGTIYTSDWMTGVTNGMISIQAEEGKACSVFIVPDTGYQVSQILVDGGSVSNEQLQNVRATQTYTFDQVYQDRSLQVSFSKDTYQISFSSGLGGSLQPILETSEEGSGTIEVKAGADVLFQIIPDQGYELAALSIDGVTVDESELENLKRNLSYTFYQVSGDHQIMAAFLKKAQQETAYVVTSSAGGHGNISPLGQQKVTAGQSITFSIVPDSGYEIASVTIDGEPISQIALRRVKEKSGFTFQPIQTNHTIAVAFTEALETEKNRYQIYYLDEDGSEIEQLNNSYENVSEYVYGTGVTLPVQAPYTKDGYTFEGWYDSQKDGNKVTAISSKEKGDKTLYARWKKRAAGSSKTVLENEWYGIFVSGFFTALPELKVEQIQKGNTTYDSLFKRDEMEGKTALAGYRLSVSGGEPDGTMKITFTLDEKMKDQEIIILQLTPNGTLAKYTAVVEDAAVSISASELGTFVLGADSAAVRQAGVKEIHGIAIEEEETKKDYMGVLFFVGAAILLIGVCVIAGIVTKKKMGKE